ncbi:MAG: ABC transporter permease [Acidimicrobiia bacterium]|nr:ABC transporter permease [Acidimicrobiia bacterium]
MNPDPAGREAAPREEELPDREETASSVPLRDKLVFPVLLVVSIVVALLIASLFLEFTGNSPGTVFSAMIRGSVGSASALVTTINHMIPLLIVAVGACIAGRASLINIGLEGQLAFGAMFGAAVGLALPAPGFVAIPVILAASVIGGAVWAAVAAAFKYGRGISEVITTLLLNFVAFEVISFAVNRSWLLQESPSEAAYVSLNPQSDRLPDTAQLPFLASGEGFRLQFGIVIAIVVAAGAAFAIARLRWGFRLRMFGFNPRAASRFGVRPWVIGGSALLLSGAMAGLAGGVLLSGHVMRIRTGFANNYGWEGLLVGLVAGFGPLYAIPVAFLYGALRAGGGVLAATGVDQALVGIVQALIVIAVTLPSLYMIYRSRQRQARAIRDRA